MKTIRTVLLSLPFVIFSGCSGQSLSGSGNKTANAANSVKSDSLYKPQVKVKVDRKYDENGRLVQFDSTYSYYYAGPGAPGQLNNDSVFGRFQHFFKGKYQGIFNQYQNDIFFNDSLFKYDFFNEDYFRKRFELNQKLFDEMYRNMDSIKKDYMDKEYPTGAPKKKTGTEV